MTTFEIRKFDLEMITPSTQSMYDLARGGSKIFMLGKPGTGKTYAITSLLYHKRHIFPSAVVVSGTETGNHYWSKHFPESFIYEELTPDILERFIARQKKAVNVLTNPWCVLLLDDCADNKKVINSKSIGTLCRNGRHLGMLMIVAIQYAIDIGPAIRSNIDFAFIFRENRLSDRKKIFDNYAAAFPDFGTFCKVLDEVTAEDHCCLVIRNTATSNKLEDCVFWWKAPKFPVDFQFGSAAYWNHDKVRRIVVQDDDRRE